ncbi:MAG: N-acetyl-gamma-glutamyl-phosphate reductase [Acidobacteriota bacterium]|nr:N-acetyl-gamma-glutamyl-phosphate reductase [Acidobacteriota bacterium]MDE2921705.1 N-acetyl-gamma-glutamyl-phosphate reductase [Acidobacteriota bacterium]MDE3266620.1 N-acetyl-gamma-glutamyl-phosphate reductase [Acidobacteriota bacterium]
MIRAAIAGASGYSGAELVRWLHGHPEVELGALAAGRQAGRSASDVFPHLGGAVAADLVETDWDRLGDAADVVFLALPHGEALGAAGRLLEAGARVVDVGADFRLRSPSAYRRWYGGEHTATAVLGEAVYGLTEWHRAAVAGARLVANPGCYPTASALALKPIFEQFGDRVGGAVVIDAKSGVSGAGRNARDGYQYSELNENLKPYGSGVHRHQPEIEQELATLGETPRVFFSPHLVPMTRGILAACYVPMTEPPSHDELEAAYLDRYASEPFVRVLTGAALPQTKATLGSNYCDLAVRVDAERGLAVVFAALDNLVKGAAGQAVQNMNVMFNLEETTGLSAVPVFP